ncbi:MAG: DUF4199 domain-containing protein [Rikenellaceae bacterium]
MTNKEKWNNAAKWGLIVGICMSCSKIIEHLLLLSGEVNKFALLSVEVLVSAALFCSLIYQALKRGVPMLSLEGKYMYGQGVNYAILISVFAATIVTLSSYIYIDAVVGGYEAYVIASVNSMKSVMSDSSVSRDFLSTYDSRFDELITSAKNKPSIFALLFSHISTYVFTGGLAGLILSWRVSTKVKQTGEINGNNEQ